MQWMQHNKPQGRNDLGACYVILYAITVRV